MRFTRPDDATAPGFLVEANSTDNCAVVVIQEWWGINQQMENVAQRLADAGHSALVPDLYRGRLASDADEAKHFMGDLDWPDATHQDLAGAVNYLARTHDRVAVLGFCMGGALTIAGAVRIDTWPARCASMESRPPSWRTRPRSAARFWPTSRPRTIGARPMPSPLWRQPGCPRE
jgi:dienelactone hydrolase